MSVKVTDKIIAPSRGTAAQALSYARANGAKRLDFVEGVLNETERLCTPDDMPDFAIVVGRMADETGGGNGTIFVSPIFVARGNVGGLGVTDGADEGLIFDTPIKAARAMVAHTLLYATGDIARGGLKPSDDPRYNAYRQAYGTRAVATTLDALTGKWFTNPQGAINSAARGNAIFKNIPDQTDHPTDPDEGEHPVPRKIIGHVPKPPMIDRTDLGRNHRIGSGRDPDQPRAGFIVGTCHHTSEGYDAGNISVLETLTWGGLWDFQIGGRYDGAKNGVITQIIGDTDPVVPWANGKVGDARAPYGDAPAFLAKYGTNGVNRRLRSIECADGTRSNEDKTAEQIESLCFLTAWIHAEQAGQTAETFEWNMHHREFGVAHQGCPGAYIVNHVNAIQARTKAIMRAYQYGDPLNPPLRVTYPAGWKGPKVPPPPTATTTTTPAPKPPPIIYPSKRTPAPDTMSHQGHTLAANKKNRFLCIQGGHFKTAPSLDAPNATPTPYKAGRSYTFDYKGTGKADGWVVAKSGSWAPVKNFEQLA